jgi:DNA-binding transcriptional MocR family regulator
MTSLSARALATLLEGWRDAGVAYAALADRIRLLILDGRVGSGTRLPAERELAGQLEVSRTTVTAAYSELREAGYLHSTRGSGSVAQLPHRVLPPANPQHSEYLDFSKAALPAMPQVVTASQLAVEQLAGYLGESGFDPVGLPVLREAIADRYTERGLPTTPDQVMVTIGAQHALSLIARTIMARGDRALIENPTYPHALDALRLAGARLVPVSVTTDDGWDESALEQAIQRTSPSLGYLMPDYHNPTGRSMSIELRERVLELAARHGTTIIADETMGELAIDAPHTRAPFAVHGSAILVGSVGKTVWGGLRVGWIRADRTVIQRLIRARSSGDLGTPLLEQLVVANLLRDFDGILDARRAYLRTGRDRLARLLSERLPDWHVPRVDGGLTAWVGLGHPVSSQLALAARNEGLIIAAGPRFGMDGAFERFLRIPFSYSAEETERGVDALAAAWAMVGRHTMNESTEELAGVV